jgi:hypothetical protein
LPQLATLKQAPLRQLVLPKAQWPSCGAACHPKNEFLELLAKADEKVSTFEAAVKNAKPALDRIDTKYATNSSWCAPKRAPNFRSPA